MLDIDTTRTLNAIVNCLHFLTSSQQFSRLKGDETGNWTGPVNFSDDGSLKPARNGRKRYLSSVTDCTTPLRERKRVPVCLCLCVCVLKIEIDKIKIYRND